VAPRPADPDHDVDRLGSAHPRVDELRRRAERGRHGIGRLELEPQANEVFEPAPPLGSQRDALAEDTPSHDRESSDE
jgi:hypothetical protein